MPLLGPADPLPHRPQRVLVAGSSGSGKTTLAGAVAAATSDGGRTSGATVDGGNSVALTSGARAEPVTGVIAVYSAARMLTSGSVAPGTVVRRWSVKGGVLLAAVPASRVA